MVLALVFRLGSVSVQTAATRATTSTTSDDDEDPTTAEPNGLGRASMEVDELFQIDEQNGADSMEVTKSTWLPAKKTKKKKKVTIAPTLIPVNTNDKKLKQTVNVTTH